MKKFAAIFLILIFCLPYKASAEEFLYTCVSGERNWAMNFVVNTEKKSVLLKSSGDLEGKKNYRQNRYENIISFSKNEISIFYKYPDHGGISYRTIYPEEGRMLITSHYGDGYVDNLTYNCLKG
tara:strand:- start:1418 stop:1789 length:372 start_codon:yes stop_codon:yes gene_type:complete